MSFRRHYSFLKINKGNSRAKTIDKMPTKQVNGDNKVVDTEMSNVDKGGGGSTTAKKPASPKREASNVKIKINLNNFK